MKTHIFLLITFVFFSFSGWGQSNQYSRTGSQPSSGGGNGNYTPSQQTGSSNHVQQTNISSDKTDYNYSTPSSSRTTYSGSRTRNTSQRTTPKANNPQGVQVNTNTQDLSKEPSTGSVTTGSNPPQVSQSKTKASAPDTLLVLSKQAKPVKFYRNQRQVVMSNEMGAYGVQVEYCKDLASARKELEQYRSRFKVAGFICEDWNLTSARNVDEFPFRIILGHYNHYTNALRLLHKVRYFIPYSFIVKYA